MNKSYQQELLQRILMDPSLESGLYLLDTDLEDREIEDCIRQHCPVPFYREILFPTKVGSPLDLFVIGLCNQCDNNDVMRLKNLFLSAKVQQKEIILYDILILLIKLLFINSKTILHIQGELDLLSFSHEELWKIKSSLIHHNIPSIVICKQKMIANSECDKLIKLLKINNNNRYMNSRLNKVYISYSHDDDHKSAIEAIKTGLKNNNINFSIDDYEVMYRYDIQDYERQIGRADKVIMFVIPSYMKSIACMYEMTQMFKNGNIRERIFPIVDMGPIPRNGDGLKKIKDYWLNEKIKKSEQIKEEPGGSAFIIDELKQIDDILKTMDDFWNLLVYEYSGKYEEMIANNATLLIKELKNTQQNMSIPVDKRFVPSEATMPSLDRVITQNGDKSIIIGNNSGNIIIK